MITSEKTIGANVRIFTKTRAQLDDTVAAIRNDIISVIQHYAKENQSDEIQIHLMEDSKCGHCGRPYPECQCGRPAPRPAV